MQGPYHTAVITPVSVRLCSSFCTCRRSPGRPAFSSTSCRKRELKVLACQLGPQFHQRYREIHEIERDAHQHHLSPQNENGTGGKYAGPPVRSQNGPQPAGKPANGPPATRHVPRVPNGGSVVPARGCGAGVVAHVQEYEVPGSSHPQFQDRRASGFQRRDARGSGDESRWVMRLVV